MYLKIFFWGKLEISSHGKCFKGLLDYATGFRNRGISVTTNNMVTNDWCHFLIDY